MTSLKESAGLELVESDEVNTILTDHRNALLAWEPAVASDVAEQCDIDAAVYLTAFADKEASGTSWAISAAVVDLTTGQVLPVAGPPVTDEDSVVGIAEEIVAQLPPVGRVAAVVQTGDELQLQVYLNRASEQVRGIKCDLYGPGESRDVEIWGLNAAAEEGWKRRSETVTVRDSLVATGQMGEIDENGLVSIALRDMNQVPPLGALVAPGSKASTAHTQHTENHLLLSAPAGAYVFMDEAFLGVTPLHAPADIPAEVQFIFKSEGYRQQSVALPPQPDTSLTIIQTKLEKIPPFGTLEVTSEPEGAAVSVDGEKRALTPVALEHFPAGVHNVCIELDGHKSYETRVEVQPEETTRIAAQLVRDAWHVATTSDPENAIVFLNDKRVGRTPLEELRLPVGTVELTLQHDGYRPERREVTVRPDAPPDPLHFDLQPRPATVLVRTTPEGATVHIDGEKIGQTPVTVKGVTPGNHELQLALEGYATSLHTFTAAAGKENECSFRLLKERGSLGVKTVPEGARVFIDGEPIGTSPINDHQVVTGPHEVSIRRAGYRTWTTELEIDTEHPAQVSLALVPQKGEKKERQPERHPSDLQQVHTTPPGNMVTSLELIQPGNNRPRKMELWVDGAPGASECRLHMRCLDPLPDALDVVKAGDMVSVVLPEMGWEGPVKRFEVIRGPLSRIQVGQLSQRKPAVRIQLDLLSGTTFDWRKVDERTLEVHLKHRTAYEVPVTEKRIALTFDDFPFADSDLLLDTLDRLGVQANFFVIGNKVRKFPETTRRAAVAGHRLENHSYTGESFRDLDAETIKEYMKLTNSRILEVAGASPELLRAPGGWYNGDHHELVHEFGLCHCGWTANTGDYKLRNANRIAEKIIRSAKPNAIILLHDGVPETVDALEIAIPSLRALGYSFVPIQKLKNTEALARCVQ